MVDAVLCLVCLLGSQVWRHMNRGIGGEQGCAPIQWWVGGQKAGSRLRLRCASCRACSQRRRPEACQVQVCGASMQVQM